jgi:hypothetical protein
MAAQDQPRRAIADDEAAGYRRAAEETLEQLSWCVNYLYRIRKPRIAAAVDKNRRSIRQRMSEPDD